MGDKVCITRVKRYNVETFRHRFKVRMVGAALLTLVFVCLMIYVVARFLEGVL